MSNLSSSRAAQVLPETLLHSGYSFFCTAAQMVFILLDTVLLKVGSKSIHFLVEVNSILLQRYFNLASATVKWMGSLFSTPPIAFGMFDDYYGSFIRFQINVIQNIFCNDRIVNISG